ncbi:MAG: ABC transporter permease subunit [Rhodobacteraceae bacterium]|nr:ABC transporter permease subunit [Paracoccaceae bacterium]
MAGAGAATAVAALVLLPLAAVLVAAGGAGAGPGPGDGAAAAFTLLQALASAALSVALAVPLARALARRRFPGRAALVTLLGAPVLLPSVVAVMALLAVFGRGGALNAALAALGLGPLRVYGPQGVILAHVFFNLPLATRLILEGWLAIPAERFRLAAALGFGPAEVGRHLERPLLATVLPGAGATIFLVCLSSFAVALILGGGPRATTLELAIYQAFRFDFDLGRAALLAAGQLVLCVLALVLVGSVALPAGFGAGLDRSVARHDAGGLLLRLQDGAVILAATAFLALPLAAVVAAGLPRLGALPPAVWAAAARSAILAVAAAGLAGTLALAIAAGRARGGGRWSEAAGVLPIALSPMVLGTGLFLLVFPLADPAALALPATAAVNALLALPFALRALAPAVAAAEAAHGRLATSLGITGGARLRLLLLPRVRRPLGFALGLAAAFAAGDLGVVVLFAGGATATLPLEMFRLMGAYRMEAASGAAVLLLLLAFGLFAAFDRGGRLGTRA